MLSDNCNEASEFDIIFARNGKQIQYGFKCTSKEVLNEWLFIDDKKYLNALEQSCLLAASIRKC